MRIKGLRVAETARTSEKKAGRKRSLWNRLFGEAASNSECSGARSSSAAPSKDIETATLALADTNVIVTHLGSLEEECATMSGDLTSCQGCSAIMSSVSDVKSGKGGHTWKWCAEGP